MSSKRDVYEGCRLLRRHRERTFWCIVLITLLIIPFVLNFWYLLSVDLGLPFLVVVLLILAFALVRVRNDSCLCPRCGHHFFFRWLAWSRTNDHCAHCGLPIDTFWNANDENAVIVRAWLAHPEPRGAIPAVGLLCTKCEYDLTGLTERVCPECGTLFDPERLFKGAIESNGP